VEDGVRICPNCGFDTGEEQADEVRRLREAGTIHPGRLGAADPDDFAGGEASERPPAHEELPAENTGFVGPEEADAGL
jgi:hypothetical protein